MQALDAHGALGQHALLSCMPNGLDVLKAPPTICLCSCLGELAQWQPNGAHSGTPRVHARGVVLRILVLG